MNVDTTLCNVKIPYTEMCPFLGSEQSTLLSLFSCSEVATLSDPRSLSKTVSAEFCMLQIVQLGFSRVPEAL